jgi:hypothetical protein
MGSPSFGNHLSRGYAHGRNFHIDRGFGMIASRKRLVRNLKQASKKMDRRTWLWSVKPRRAKERVPRVTVRVQHHIQVRRT